MVASAARTHRSDERADDHGKRTRRHRRRHERHHDQVHRRGDERQPPEFEEHDGHRGGLRRERDAEDVGDPASREPRGRACQSCRERRAPGEDPGRGEHGKPEPRVVDEGRVDEKEHRTRPAKRCGRRARPAQLPREERDARHGASADHRWRRPHEHDVRHDGDRRQHGPPPTSEAAGDCAECRGNDRDIPARDGHDMTRAGGGERGSEIAVDAITEPDQNASREPGLGLRDRPVEARRGRPSKALERSGNRAFHREDIERILPGGCRSPRSAPDMRRSHRLKAAGSCPEARPDRPERPTGTTAAWLRRAPGPPSRGERLRAGCHRVARRPSRPRRSRDRRRRGSSSAPRCSPRPAGEAPIAITPIATGMSARGGRVERATRAATAPRRSATPSSASTGAESAAAPNAAAAAPTATHAAPGIGLAHRDQRLELLERLLADDATLAQLVDRSEGRAAARLDDLSGRDRADAGEGVELSLRGRVDVDHLAPGAFVPGAAVSAPPGVAGGSSRDGTRIWAPSANVAARLISTPTRPASTRGLNPPAASIASPIRAPVARRYTPGLTTAPATSTTIWPAGTGSSPAVARTAASGPVTLASPTPAMATIAARPAIRIAPASPAIARRALTTGGSAALPGIAARELATGAPPSAPAVGASNTRQGADCCSTSASSGGIGAGEDAAEGPVAVVRRAARPAARRVDGRLGGPEM